MVTIAEAVLHARQMAASRPATLENGVVTALPDAGFVRVNCFGRDETVACDLTRAPLIDVLGRIVTVARDGLGGSYVSAVWGVLDGLPPAPPPVMPVAGTDMFTAVDAGAYRDGGWRTDTASPGQGSDDTGANTGSWFYGGVPGATLQGATVVGCAVLLTRRSGGDATALTAQVYLHASPDRPLADVVRTAGPITVSLDIAAPTWVDLPVGWGQGIVDDGCGLGIAGEPYLPCTGLDTDSQSGLIRIDWTY